MNKSAERRGRLYSRMRSSEAKFMRVGRDASFTDAKADPFDFLRDASFMGLQPGPCNALSEEEGDAEVCELYPEEKQIQEQREEVDAIFSLRLDSEGDYEYYYPNKTAGSKCSDMRQGPPRDRQLAAKRRAKERKEAARWKEAA